MFKQSVPMCFNLFFLFYISLCALLLPTESVLKHTRKFCILIFLLFNIFQIALAWRCSQVVMLSGDIEVNPGPKKKDKNRLPMYYWNFNIYLSEAATGENVFLETSQNSQ